MFDSGCRRVLLLLLQPVGRCRTSGISGTLTDWFDFLAQLGVAAGSALWSLCFGSCVEKQTGKAPASQCSRYSISRMSTQTSDGSPLVHRPLCWCRTDLRGLGQLFTFVLGDPRCSGKPAGESRLPDRK